MREEELKSLIEEVREATRAAAPAGLGGAIKSHIPDHLGTTGGRDTINIIIDLRVRKSVAAAIIIITMVFYAMVFGGREIADRSIFKESVIWFKYSLMGKEYADESMGPDISGYCEMLAKQGKEFVYYGPSSKAMAGDKDAILLYWRSAENDKYMVVFADLRTEEVSAGQLIELQSKMLRKK